MSDYLENIDNLPDISFIDNKTLEDVQVLLINSFQEKYKTITGKKITLSRADPNRLILLSCAQVIYQGLQNIDKAGKMNFLKYKPISLSQFCKERSFSIKINKPCNKSLLNNGKI